jgi:hypothetical protein
LAAVIVMTSTSDLAFTWAIQPPPLAAIVASTGSRCAPDVGTRVRNSCAPRDRSGPPAAAVVPRLPVDRAAYRVDPAHKNPPRISTSRLTRSWGSLDQDSLPAQQAVCGPARSSGGELPILPRGSRGESTAEQCASRLFSFLSVAPMTATGVAEHDHFAQPSKPVRNRLCRWVIAFARIEVELLPAGLVECRAQVGGCTESQGIKCKCGSVFRSSRGTE